MLQCRYERRFNGVGKRGFDRASSLIIILDAITRFFPINHFSRATLPRSRNAHRGQKSWPWNERKHDTRSALNEEEAALLDDPFHPRALFADPLLLVIAPAFVHRSQYHRPTIRSTHAKLGVDDARSL